MTPQEEWSAYARDLLTAVGGLAKASVAGLATPAEPSPTSLPARLCRVAEVFESPTLAKVVGLAALADLDRLVLLALRVIAAHPAMNHPSIGLCTQVSGLTRREVPRLAQTGHLLARPAHKSPAKQAHPHAPPPHAVPLHELLEYVRQCRVVFPVTPTRVTRDTGFPGRRKVPR